MKFFFSLNQYYGIITYHNVLETVSQVRLCVDYGLLFDYISL